MVQAGFPVCFISMGDTFRSELGSLANALRQRQAPIINIGDQPFEGHQEGHDWFIPVPNTLPEWLTPIAAIVPGQLLAYHLAIARGFNPDQPRVIHKVTLTR
jgi:glucosamine--fructose-6-phosphate aminotransferase (isomerizing)